MLCVLTLFASTCIVAVLDGFPIKEVVHQRFEDGSYIFRPGHLQYMISSSIGFSLLIIPFKYIYLYMLDQLEKRQRNRINNLESQKKNVELRFDALQAKVNPHFLYNSLNSIAGLATVDGDKTRQMALALSRFFRYSMNREQEMLITVEQEAEMIETYLEIEKIRFGDKLTYRVEITDDAKPLSIPRMLLQPIVENSIKHGMKGNITLLNVEIVFAMSDSALIISVKDDGTPYDDNFIAGYGIQSVYEKLDLLFPGKHHIEISTDSEKVFRISLAQTK
jgi:two-component system, LytTR family, sensor kinase